MLFNKKTKPDYYNQVKWYHTQYPMLKTWDIWAVNNNLIVARIIFSFIVFIFLIVPITGFFFLREPEDPFGWPLLIIFSIPILPIILFYFILFGKFLFVYRCTEYGLEFYSGTDLNRKFIIGTIIIIVVGVIVILYAAIDTNQPEVLWLALIGPGGMGLAALSRLKFKENLSKKVLTNHKQRLWKEVTHILIDKKRKIITLQRQKKNNLSGQLQNYKTFVFCPKDRFDELLIFFKEQMPNIPCIEEPVKIEWRN
ncbi:hypothetical protein MTZ49_10680 [Entomomonas sp. E2T0]|uniref:hypothetical protein n=1 Tax=Entomomonas sp. E2T0 TaxID=2930213 RepID=UPI0022282A26|nr:hypothetical protein [Entomomonas sp. E2T0]UYZ83067.1 hypothetical protein MTZ49_10680 [Entomomonas sp. E2T0]